MKQKYSNFKIAVTVSLFIMLLFTSVVWFIIDLLKRSPMVIFDWLLMFSLITLFFWAYFNVKDEVGN